MYCHLSWVRETFHMKRNWFGPWRLKVVWDFNSNSKYIPGRGNCLLVETFGIPIWLVYSWHTGGHSPPPSCRWVGLWTSSGKQTVRGSDRNNFQTDNNWYLPAYSPCKDIGLSEILWHFLIFHIYLAITLYLKSFII